MKTPAILRPLLKASVVLLLALALTQSPSAQDENATRPTRRPLESRPSILVTGSAEISAAPDQAIARFGMTAQNSRASVAQNKVNEVIQKTIDAIQKAGVKRQSIHTASISLTPIYSDKLLSSGGSKVSGFRADNTIEVTIDDLKLIGEVIDAAINAGANEVHGVYFRLQDDRAQRHNALAQASQEAKAKAETIAKALGVPLGNAIEASESGAIFPMTIESAGPAFMGFARKSIPASTAPTSVEPGQIRIEATITVRYQIGAKTGQ
jgi:uncharacterized protein YggE